MPLLISKVSPAHILNGLLTTLRRPVAENDVVLQRERGQALLRVVICLATEAYLVYLNYPQDFTAGPPLWFLVVTSYAAFSILLAISISRSSLSYAGRRYLANIADAAAITFALSSTGENGVPLFALYLWITLGSGFRFGIPALTVSTILSVIGFGVAVVLSQPLQESLLFSAGVLLLLVIVPMGAAQFLRRLKLNKEPEYLPHQNVKTEDSRVPRSLRYWKLNMPPFISKTQTASEGTQTTAEGKLSDARQDILIRERGQAMVRIGVCILLTIYLLVMSQVSPSDGKKVVFGLAFIVTYTVFSIVLATWVYRARRSLPWRRYAANIGDVVTISSLMIAAGESGTPLFVLYLWVTFGNGFRFGIPALVVSSALSVVGFTAVVMLTSVWKEHPSLAVAVFLSLILLPLYTGHLLKMLNSALLRANEASAAKSQFLARMSHELRTPLNGILGSVDLLRGSRRLSPEEQSLLSVIEDSVNVSLGQINNVLDFSKLEAGKLTLERSDLDLHALVNGVAQMVRPAASQKGLRFLVRFASDVPYQIKSDAHHLRAVLLNLTSNAVKFTEQGSVSLDVIKKEQRPDVTVLRFEVLDTGIGISPDSLTRIFDSFTQEDTSTTRRYGGTGLGTTIAKQLVELMDGKIGVQSIKGRGSLFWFEIPVETQSSDLSKEVNAAVGRVVFLSKDMTLTTNARQILSQQIVITASEEEAVSLLERALRLGNAIYLLLVDEIVSLASSGSNGCVSLCEKANAANVPVVLISDNPPTVEKLREWGYSSVLPRDLPTTNLYTLLHASPFWRTDINSKVSTIPPWLWQDRDENERARILVADDNRTNLLITRKILERAGYEVETVESGEDALDQLYIGGFRLAILDMHMPGLDGPTLLQQYRANRPKSKLPVIILTANASISAKTVSADAGADAYLSKPAGASQLLLEVRRLLNATEVEVIPWDASRKQGKKQPPAPSHEEVIDLSVLAELDRLYQEPKALAAVIKEYEREGERMLARISSACKTANHPSYSDAVHCLKSNAANVGARRLMATCREAGAAGIVKFMQERDVLFLNLQEAFDQSLKALKEAALIHKEEGS